METQRYSIKLNMKSTGVLESGIRLKQGDSEIVLEIYVYSGGKLWTESTDKPAVVFRKPDGNIVYDTAILSGNYYKYTIKGTELEAAGTVACDVKFPIGNGRVSTRTFTFMCETDTFGDDANQSETYIAPIEKAVKESADNAAAAKNYADDAEEYAKTAERIGRYWQGTKEEYEALAEKPPAGTKVCITNDYDPIAVDGVLSKTSNNAIANSAVTEALEEINETTIKSDTIQNIKTGEFRYSCAVGVNKITSSSTLASGTFPSNPQHIIALFVANHGSDDKTKDIVLVDDNSIIIHAEKAQSITIKYIEY